MTATKADVIKLLDKKIPSRLLELLLNEYNELKTSYALGRYRPDELSGGRFAEIFLRVLESLGDPTQQFTPIGEQIKRAKVVNYIKNDGGIPDSLRIFVLPLLEVLLDVRNRRDVAHIGDEINPNFSDSRLVNQIADWTLTELIRVFSQRPIIEAQNIVDRINQIHVPIIEEHQGFVKVLDAQLTAADKTLVILYHKQPEPMKDKNLCLWVNYKNPTRYKSIVLGALSTKSYIHYGESGLCFLTQLGIQYIEKNISLELTV